MVVLHHSLLKVSGKEHLIPKGRRLVNLAALKEIKEPQHERITRECSRCLLPERVAWLRLCPSAEIAVSGVINDVPEPCGAVVLVMVIEIDAVLSLHVLIQKSNDGLLLLTCERKDNPCDASSILLKAFQLIISIG